MKDQFRARQVALWLNLVPDLVCKQLHDQIGLFQPLFLNFIRTQTYPGLNLSLCFLVRVSLVLFILSFCSSLRLSGENYFYRRIRQQR